MAKEPDEVAPKEPGKILDFDSFDTASGSLFESVLRRAVRSFGLPEATPKGRAVILEQPDVTSYFLKVFGTKWRWHVMAEIHRQEQAEPPKRKAT